ncbi:MAG: S1 RNA-binding domain-containing protein [candidate division WOR-3 bacterium]|nr:S1 RNA-binding domain-containing protein [candidate division WOR-3 bacterium]MCX7948320.1 S1 RNA-binding domain-containing protein [candidate division WOR-3 bacterium]MDW8150852.1 S1 RNA-binding domain-containing protein [candidate division WOR-3 bacterium]
MLGKEKVEVSDSDYLELINKQLKVEVLKEGEIVKGKILKITPREVFVDIGGKAEGILKVEEIRSGEYNVGDEISVYIEKVDSKEGVKVSKHKADFMLNWEKIRNAYENNETVYSKVLRIVKGGLVVDVFGVEAFLPGSQIDRKKIKNFNSFVGKILPVKIIKIDVQRKNIVVSRIEVLEEEEELAKQRLSEIKIGDVFDGVISSIVEFGLFVNIGGIEGLVHISEISWNKIKRIDELYKVGDRVKVQVIDIDRDNRKIILSIKRLQPHPWQSIAQKYPIGSKVKGKVKKILDFGFFVELESGIDGLVHISEMKWGRPPSHPSEMVRVGQEVELVVLNVDVERERISLGMKQVQPDPWAVIEEKYSINSIVKGKVIDFDIDGAIVELEPEIFGYIHVSNMSWTKKVKNPEEFLRKGQKIKALVKDIDKKHRMIELSLKELTANPWTQISETLKPDTILKAPIIRILDKGIVVDIYDGIEGFVPISSTQRKGNPREVYSIGEELNLAVVRVEPEKKRVLLSERQYYKLLEKQKQEEAKKKLKELQEPARLNLGDILSKELSKLKELTDLEE